MILIDQYTQIDASAATITQDHNVKSVDSVLFILLYSAGVSTTPTVTYNGVSLVLVNALVDATDNINLSAWIMNNPPVGTYPVVISNASSSYNELNIFSLLGVEKSTTGFSAISARSAASTTASQIFASQQSDTMVFTLLWSSTANPTPYNGQTPFLLLTESTFKVSGFFKYTGSGIVTDQYSLSASVVHAQLTVILQSAAAPSMWFPNIQSRFPTDSIFTSQINSPINNVLGYLPSTFWHNSFLHTVGRVLSPPQGFSLAAETELETSQIVIDKITQAAQTSASSITVDHNVTSQDAVLLIFASQMGISQALNSVNLNGVPQTALGNPSVSTLTAGAYFVINPNVGINTVSAIVTLPTALELVVISLLGVDKKTTNAISVANSGASGSPSSTIQVTAANSLLIDYIGSLGTSITENPAQTVYFDQPQLASEAAGSIKLSTVGSQTMSWTTVTAAWVQLVVALEPANALSMWYPAIDLRNLSDVIAVNALDDSTNPVGNFYQTYGTYPSTFYQNSFLHTVGRIQQAALPVTAQQPLELQLLGIG